MLHILQNLIIKVKVSTINPDLETEMFSKLNLYFELMHGKIDWK